MLPEEHSSFSQKHELTGIRVYDEKEEELPDIGWVHMHDIETGAEKYVNTSSKKCEFSTQKMLKSTEISFFQV